MRKIKQEDIIAINLIKHCQIGSIWTCPYDPSPYDPIEYLIVHELAHLRVPNHSPEFWNMVSIQVPMYEDTKRMAERKCQCTGN